MSHRILLVVLLMLSLAGTSARANPAPQAAFAEAKAAYDAGEPAKAAAIYQRVLDGGFVSPELLFNLGNAHFRAGQSGEAIRRYRQALVLSPGDADIRANFRFAVERTGAAVPEPWLLAEVFRRASRETWTKVAVGAWWIGASLVALSWLLPRARIPAGWTAGLAGMVMVLGVTGARLSGGLTGSREAVTLAAGLEIRSAPASESTALVRLPEGSIVDILEDGGPWLRVRSGKDSGWVPSGQVGRVRI
jgi:tetratricopeptide (TPR) repeat protein